MPVIPFKELTAISRILCLKASWNLPLFNFYTIPKFIWEAPEFLWGSVSMLENFLSEKFNLYLWGISAVSHLSIINAKVSYCLLL